MFARFSSARKSLARFFAFTALLWLAACDVTLAPDANVGRTDRPRAPSKWRCWCRAVQRKRRRPILARNFENAARLAIADLQRCGHRPARLQHRGGNPAASRTCRDTGGQ